jgi:L,D-transpeptidase ErfK/SrfK
MVFRYLAMLFCLFIFPADSFASEAYSYSKNNGVIGETKTYAVKGEESLIEIARKFGIGYNEITEANPRLDPFIPGNGKTVQISTQWVLPDVAAYKGIVINLSEMRLYYFTRERVMTYAIGIGDEGKNTPVGNFKIVDKIINPPWVVPASIRKERPELPKVVPPGPNNPLGSHAMRLSRPSILIHGTDKPFAVGRKASHGCIRLYPEDIPDLFKVVPNKTKVTIVRQPVKTGVSGGKVYLEVHKDNAMRINYFNEAVRLLKKNNVYVNIDKTKLLAALKEKNGVPVIISK